MARSKESFNKREKEKQRQKEKREKKEKMEERKMNQGKGKTFDEMLAYVDEDGNISSTPPDPEKRKIVNLEDIEIGVTKLQETEGSPKEGRIDYFDASKGFGFIVQQDGTKLFFHINDAAYPVSKGDLVNFDVERGPRGWSAKGVTRKA
jgi:cold shock CspA family protein